ncbi:MAG: hypothetical protein U0163_20250 [Gemmatimonadaceae bacterium]
MATPGSPFFDLQKRHAADGRALGGDLHRDASPPPRVADVPQLAQGPADNGDQEDDGCPS